MEVEHESGEQTRVKQSKAEQKKKKIVCEAQANNGRVLLGSV
jgi:hypothetical protein